MSTDGGRAGGRRLLPWEDAGASRDGALLSQGLVDLPSAETVTYFNEHYGKSFSGPADYLSWIYGGGGVVNDPAGGAYPVFQLPAGKTPADVVNTPLTFNSETPGFGKLVQGVILAIATAGVAQALTAPAAALDTPIAAGAGEFAGANAADLAMEIAPGVTVPESFAGATFGGIDLSPALDVPLLPSLSPAASSSLFAPLTGAAATVAKAVLPPALIAGVTKALAPSKAAPGASPLPVGFMPAGAVASSSSNTVKYLIGALMIGGALLVAKKLW